MFHSSFFFVGNLLLSERDGNLLKWRNPCRNELCVGNLLLSERDGNKSIDPASDSKIFTRRKPTTLWKRWKLMPYTKSSFGSFTCRKPTTLWKRWKQNVPFSEREGWINTSRKPTTLWKRWKPYSLFLNNESYPRKSETYYSLKEMETLPTPSRPLQPLQVVGNLLLSERDGSKRKKGWEWTQP